MMQTTPVMPMSSPEQARQAAVLAALQAPLQPAPGTLNAAQTAWPHLQAASVRTDTAGLLAYQLNAQATAQRVLASSYPTIAAMLGADALDALALLLWQNHPPAHGDLGLWGGALPMLLATHPDLQSWPWLADSARLDWARHVCERAADATFEPVSLQRLGDTEPGLLHIELLPDVQLVSSTWPIDRLHEAHLLPPEQQAQACAEALAAGRTSPPQDEQGGQGREGAEATAHAGAAHTVIVWREGWVLRMQALPVAEAHWMTMLLAAPAQGTRGNLGTLLDQAHPDFDFATWLAQALQNNWLWRVRKASTERADRRRRPGEPASA
jgi:hypothetical protein